MRIVQEARFPSPRLPRAWRRSWPSSCARCGRRWPPRASASPAPSLDGACPTPNLPWVLTRARSSRATTGLPAVRLINDFAAAAVGVLALAAREPRHPAGGRRRARTAPGPCSAPAPVSAQALLLWDGQRYRVHADRGRATAASRPQGELQRELLAYLEPSFDPRSRSSGSCRGPASCASTAFLVGAGAFRRAPEVAAGDRPGGPRRGDRRATRSPSTDLACEQALDLFVAAYGAEAGNLALRSLATGGVYVGRRDRAQDPAEAAGRHVPRGVPAQGPDARADEPHPAARGARAERPACSAPPSRPSWPQARPRQLSPPVAPLTVAVRPSTDRRPTIHRLVSNVDLTNTSCHVGVGRRLAGRVTDENTARAGLYRNPLSYFGGLVVDRQRAADRLLAGAARSP